MIKDWDFYGSPQITEYTDGSQSGDYYYKLGHPDYSPATESYDALIWNSQEKSVSKLFQQSELNVESAGNIHMGAFLDNINAYYTHIKNRNFAPSLHREVHKLRGPIGGIGVEVFTTHKGTYIENIGLSVV